MVNMIFQVVNASIYFFAVNTLFILEEKSNWTHWKNIYTNMTKSTNTSFSFIHSTVLHIWDFFMHFYESLILLIQRYLSREKQLTYCMFPVPLQLWGCMWQMPWLKNHNISKECNSNDITLPQFLLRVYISSKYILWKELSITNVKVVAGEKGSNFHEESCELILTWYI